MRETTRAERTRAALGLGLLAGVLVSPAAFVAFPQLTTRHPFATFGVVAGAVVFLLVWPRIGALRAAVLAILTGLGLTVATYAIGFAACAATGCVG